MITHIATRNYTGKSLTDSKFGRWLVNAELGDVFEYHRGFLACDIVAHASLLSKPDQVELSRVARCVWRASEKGFVHLAQRRRAANEFSYLAIARTRPNPTAASPTSLSSLLLEEVE